jgi:hypothetical protein
MNKKQLKIALNDDFYAQLAKLAKKRKLPISSYARSLMSDHLAYLANNSDNKRKEEDLILLSDVVGNNQSSNKKSTQPEADADKPCLRDKSAGTSLSKSAKSGKPVNIQITVN